MSKINRAGFLPAPRRCWKEKVANPLWKYWAAMQNMYSQCYETNAVQDSCAPNLSKKQTDEEEQKGAWCRAAAAAGAQQSLETLVFVRGPH